MDVPTTLFDLINAAAEPRTAVQLAKALPGKVSSKTVASALNQLAGAGKIKAFTQGRTTAYATRPPLDLCTEALALCLTHQQEATPPAKLKAAVLKSLQPWFDEALGRLVVQGIAYWLPRGKTRLVLPRPIRPSDLLSSNALNQFKKLLAEANRHRRQPRRIEDLLAWLDAEGNAPRIAAPATAPAPTATQLRQWYNADLAQSSTSMIPIPFTWKHYESWAATHDQQADAETFRHALEALYNEGAAMLEPHERPQSLPESERLLQVPMSLGPPGYYWSPMA